MRTVTNKFFKFSHTSPPNLWSNKVICFYTSVDGSTVAGIVTHNRFFGSVRSPAASGTGLISSPHLPSLPTSYAAACLQIIVSPQCKAPSSNPALALLLAHAAPSLCPPRRPPAIDAHLPSAIRLQPPPQLDYHSISSVMPPVADARAAARHRGGAAPPTKRS